MQLGSSFYIELGSFSLCALIILSISIDKIGFILVWMFAGVTIVLFSVLFIYWVDFVPLFISIFCFSVGGSIALIPGISIFPYLLHYKKWGRGFGLCLFSLSLGQVIAIVVTLKVQSTASDYYPFLATGCFFISFLLMCFINFLDYRFGRILNQHHKIWRDLMWNKTPALS